MIAELLVKAQESLTNSFRSLSKTRSCIEGRRTREPSGMCYVFDAASNMKRYLALRYYCTILQTDWPGSTETHMARGSTPPLASCSPCSWESTAKTSGNRARTLETRNPDQTTLPPHYTIWTSVTCRTPVALRPPVRGTTATVAASLVTFLKAETA